MSKINKDNKPSKVKGRDLLPIIKLIIIKLAFNLFVIKNKPCSQRRILFK